VKDEARSDECFMLEPYASFQNEISGVHAALLDLAKAHLNRTGQPMSACMSFSTSYGVSIMLSFMPSKPSADTPQ
jgi:hypothetical protein